VLTELRVQGLAVIADARLELGPGLNVLTGETGAGKSLLIDALALLLGERAESDLVRKGASRAVVEGVFELPVDRLTALPPLLDNLGVELEDGRLILKREVQASGRSRAWINGSPCTAGTLGEVGGLLVDLHGQHETQSLLRESTQRSILDAFANAGEEAAGVREAWDECERLRQERTRTANRRADALRRADYLRHVSGEIGKAAPRAGELEQLEDEARRLEHAEELGRTAAELADLLAGDDQSASHALGRAGKLLAALERIDARGSAGWREMLAAALLNVDELEQAVREYAEGLELDPVRLASVGARRDLLFGLEQKYGPGLERVLAAGTEAKAELELLDTADADLEELGRLLRRAEDSFEVRCRSLTAKRKTGARKLGAAVSRHLAGLGMPDGTLRIALAAGAPPGPNGAESVEFVCSLNPGMGERPVAKAASGGELSRLMLALKVELVRQDPVGTLVFDEVDAGIGGLVAGKVAEALGQVAEEHQVLVITHLPQIAAAAARHLVVAKASAEGLAQTDVATLHGEDRVEEIARMLGGGGTTARKHAAEMIREAAT
jgi:DNA repair protein RecN (Recombination protein N)